MELSEKAKQLYLDHPIVGLDFSDKPEESTLPLTVYSSSNMRSIVVVAPGAEPEPVAPPTEAELKEFRERSVVYQISQHATKEGLAELDEAIKNLSEEWDTGNTKLFQSIIERLVPIAFEEEIARLDEELVTVQRIGGAS